MSAAKRPIPTFTFGRHGGTIAPFEATISPSGRVSVTGAVRRLDVVTVSKDAQFGLSKLADTEKFWTMPRAQRCPTRIGGLATEYIEITRGSQHRRVETYGGCNKAFEQLYALLKAAAALV